MASSPMSNKSWRQPSSQATSWCWTISAPTRCRGYVKRLKLQAQSCFTCLPICRTSIRSRPASGSANVGDRKLVLERGARVDVHEDRLVIRLKSEDGEEASDA